MISYISDLVYDLYDEAYSSSVNFPQTLLEPRSSNITNTAVRKK